MQLRFISGLTVLALACGAAACNRDSNTTESVPADTWAVVDGRSITRDEVDKAFRSSQDEATTLSAEEAMTLKLSILNEMIVQNILLEKARVAKIQVPDSELDSAYNERKKNMTEEQFQAELKKRSVSPADLRENLRRELLSKKLMEQEVTNKVNVSEQEISEFYNTNRAQFTVAEESYRIAQIVITPVREPQQTNRTGNDATTPQEASFKVRMVLERLKAGAQFADVAADYSEDPETSSRGGDLGLIPLSRLNQAPPELRNAVIGKKPGSANVVQANGAYTVVAVIAHEQAGERNLGTPGVKDAITSTLKQRKEQLLRTAYLSAARGDAKVVNHQARRIVANGGKP